MDPEHEYAHRPSSRARAVVKTAQRTRLGLAGTHVQVSAAALMAEEDTSETSDTETNSLAGESDIGADDTPPLLESSDDSDQEATDVTDLSIPVPANRKASRTKKATANFARLTRRQVILADESAQWLKQLDNDISLADLTPAHSSAGAQLGRARDRGGAPSIPGNLKTQVGHAHLRARAHDGPPSERSTRPE